MGVGGWGDGIKGANKVDLHKLERIPGFPGGTLRRLTVRENSGAPLT